MWIFFFILKRTPEKICLLPFHLAVLVIELGFCSLWMLFISFYLGAVLALDLVTRLAAGDMWRGSSGVTRSLHGPDICAALPLIDPLITVVSVCKAWSDAIDDRLSSSCIPWPLSLEFKKAIREEFRDHRYNKLFLKTTVCHNKHATHKGNTRLLPNRSPVAWGAPGIALGT